MMKREKSQYQHVEHEFGPVYDQNSRVLILGSFPSVKSREQQFYYGHPQNRFWKMLAAVCGVAVPENIEGKRKFLLENKIALWDVIESCDIIGSSDSSIRNVEPADLERILAVTGNIPILCNGGTSYKLFQKHQEKRLGIQAQQMPSTSPANAAWKLDMLVEAWGEALLPILNKEGDKR